MKEFRKFIGTCHNCILIHEIHTLYRDDDGLSNIVAAGRIGEDLYVFWVGEVAQHDLDDRHLGQAKQIPGAAVVAAVQQLGACDNLTLDKAG